MTRTTMTFALIIAALLLAACANPATDKPRATTTDATAESSAPTAGGEMLAITPENSKVEFIGSKVTGSHNGSFKQFSGTVNLVDNKPESSQVKIDIDTNSVETDAGGLTEHLKTQDFFDVAKYPKANFTSVAIKPGGDKGATHTITGNLDLHGIKKSVTFPATIKVEADAVTVNSEFAVNRRDFNINYAGKANDLIRDEVVIKLDVRAPRKK